MLKLSKFVIALVLGASAGPFHSAIPDRKSATAIDEGEPTPASAGNGSDQTESAVDVRWRSVDPVTEQRLLELTNQSRAKSGLTSLALDPGLTRAARTHAQAMVSAAMLSHQLAGETDLPQRLAATSLLLLDQSGENVALDYDAISAHHHLMLSPHHRENLLNPAYNVIGVGAVRKGEQIYIVQDFGHALPNYSSAEAKHLIATSVAYARTQSHQPSLQRRDLPEADNAACSMASGDRLATTPVHQLAKHFTVLTYTTLQPRSLPSAANRALARREVRSFAVGACYARTRTYPSGTYWVVVSLD